MFHKSQTRIGIFVALLAAALVSVIFASTRATQPQTASPGAAAEFTPAVDNPTPIGWNAATLEYVMTYRVTHGPNDPTIKLLSVPTDLAAAVAPTAEVSRVIEVNGQVIQLPDGFEILSFICDPLPGGECPQFRIASDAYKYPDLDIYANGDFSERVPTSNPGLFDPIKTQLPGISRGTYSETMEYSNSQYENLSLFSSVLTLRDERE